MSYVEELERTVAVQRERIAQLERALERSSGGCNIGDGPFFASKNRQKFHRGGCEWLAWVPGKSLIEFASHEEAAEAGYKPCGTCRA